MEIGDRIRLSRQRSGISQRKLAADVKVSAGLVGQWENHTKIPGRENLAAVAKRTGASIDYLLGNAPDPLETASRMDGDTLTLLRLWHQLSDQQKRTHLDLFRSSVNLRRELEEKIKSEVVDGGLHQDASAGQ